MHYIIEEEDSYLPSDENNMYESDIYLAFFAGLANRDRPFGERLSVCVNLS